VADNYVSEGGISGDALATHIETSPTGLIELGDVESITGGPPDVVVRRGKVSTRDAIGVTYLVEDGGELKIAAHSWFD